MALAQVEIALENDEEDALVARCRAGDRAALRTFYDLHFLYVVRAARKLGTPAAETEDVAQEVFGIAFRKIEQLQTGKAAWWLYRICSKVVSGHHRRRRIRRALAHLIGPAGHAGADAEDELNRSDAQEQVARILERMGAKKREVLVAFEIEHLTGEEIAERLGCPVDTVWTRLHNARKEFNSVGRQLNLLDEARGG